MKDHQLFNVHVVVDSKSMSYFDYLIQNFKHTAKRPAFLQFFCYSLDRRSFRRFNHDNRIKSCIFVPSVREARMFIKARGVKRRLKDFLTGHKVLGGSDGHSLGLNAINSMMSRLGGHNIIADSDVAILRPHWDQHVLKMFESYHLFGTSYEPIGGFSSGVGKVQTYKNFPNANWLALRKDVSLKDFDWMPRKNENLTIDTVERSKIFGLPIGFEMVCDGGWCFPEYCAHFGYKALSMEHVKPSSGKAQVIKTDNDYNEEYLLSGKAFVGHQRGGSRHKFKQDPMSIAFYACVEKAVGTPTN